MRALESALTAIGIVFAILLSIWLKERRDFMPMMRGFVVALADVYVVGFALYVFGLA